MACVKNSNYNKCNQYKKQMKWGLIMKKKHLFATTLLAAGIALAGCNAQDEPKQEKEKTTETSH